MINIYGQKIALISDIHLGIHTNSEEWHKIILDYGIWLKNELVSKGIKDIFVLGDIFNDRSDIGVRTLHVAENFFKIFTEGTYNFNVVLLAGNHDSYFKDNADINSISILRGWKNITVVDTLQIAEWFNKKYALVPWGVDINQISEKMDGIFGHFDINTFKINTMKLCEHGIDSDILLDKGKLIMSGHYHTKQERIYPNGRIIYLGCPYSQNWGDAEDIKGYYILDVKEGTYEVFENIISPRYHKIKLTDFLDKTRLSEIKQRIKGNFIKILVDRAMDYEQFDKLQNKLNGMLPMDLSSDFSEIQDDSTPENYEAVDMDIPTMIPEYIDSLDKGELRDKIINELVEIHNTALTRVKIESN